MSAKGYVTGNDAADRLLASLNGKSGEPKWSQEQAQQLVSWKHAVRGAIPKILASERNRTIASVRARLDCGLDGYIGDPRLAVRMLLDEMEQAS